jgi:hypothetical protein
MIRFLLILIFMAATASTVAAAPRTRDAKASLEFAPASRASLAQIEVAIGDASVAVDDRQAVTDMALFVFKPGGDVRASLHAANNAESGSGTFTVRIFVVAGGRLYTQTRGQCTAWLNDVAMCSASCDAGDFGVRRNGSAALELLLGAIPGGAAGAGNGVSLTACGFDDSGDARLTVKTGRSLAAVGFDDN